MNPLKLTALAAFVLLLLLPAAFTPVASSQSGATEAPTGFDNQTNGFTPQGTPVPPGVEDPEPGTFEADKFIFESQEKPEDGLGPVYNAQSCAECHQNPVTGGISQIFELRAGHSGPDGKFVDAPGGSLIQARATDPRVQERVPDGARIIFSGSHPTAGFELGVMGHDGGQAGFLTDRGLVGNPPVDSNKSWPSVSPDNRRIAYHARVNSQWEIFTVNIEGRDVKQLTNTPQDDQNPAWSPDGTKIAFASRRTGNFDIFVMNADGTNVVNVTNDELYNDTQPAWSPDGTQLAFIRVSIGGGSGDLYKRSSSPGGLPPTRLTNTAGPEHKPSWSPDGAFIAYDANVSGLGTDIYKIPAGGGTPTRLTTEPGTDQQPAWSPDGTKIAFVSNRATSPNTAYHVWVMNADGTQQTGLGRPSAQELTPAWTSETGENIRTFRASLNVLGDGFVECIDDVTLQIISNQQPAGMQGTFVFVPVLESDGCNPEVPSTCLKRIGRFGWKASVASLLSFSALAYRGEMGITSPLQPTESTSLGRSVKLFDLVPELEDQGTPANPFGVDVEAFTRFMRSTKAPPRDRELVPDDATDPGSQLFDQIGCAICHVRNITTAPPGTPINGFTFTVPEALGNKIIHPFGDFLLHDIGTGDGIVEAGGEATRNKVRTAPLWGLRTRDRLMHDGGSSSPPSNSGSQSFTINEAIMRHGGEAAGVRSAYTALTEMQKRQLIKFLKSL